MKYYDDIEQGTQEWLDLRCGLITASVASTLLTAKGAISKGAGVTTLAHDMASQRITKNIEEGYQSWDMERGHIEEEIARELYIDSGKNVDLCGFIKSNKIGFDIGFSPDGLIGGDGLIEIKSRKQKFQVGTIVSNCVPMEYMAQIQVGLMISERVYCDFIQYSNGMPLFVKRVEPDIEYIEKMTEAIINLESMIVEIIDEYEDNSKGLIIAPRIDIMNGDDNIEGSN